MALTVNTNIASLIAQKNLNNTNNLLTKSVERLSTGLRINRAADDAAGLALSTTLKAQIRKHPPGFAERQRCRQLAADRRERPG